ncbi:hypothetical protein SAMN05216464_11394 [Mucilaginibacter pineti]|uniref:HNH endonuclease n=1 Tax=Mucilaginibacter pineti TaxID=1391627 RepID=A0A1G7INH4_9SPHI|nr:hypothetical protein [Mucilaginibacter pineti]SDF14094.1 hypothetical protein SAMN05216464_11394 [Mucilaginibacter pineti]
MLHIDLQNKWVAKAHREHLKYVYCRIRKKLTGETCGDSACGVCAQPSHIIKGLPHSLDAVLTDRNTLETLIGGSPDDLQNLNELIWFEMIPDFNWDEYNLYLPVRDKELKKLSDDQQYLVYKYDRFYRIQLRIIDYDTWFQNKDNEPRYDAYRLAVNLDRRTCTYCNRIWTTTIKNRHNKKVMRANYDHWFPQTKFPLLALSFCNLIPSCTVCNSSVKNDTNYSLATHMHPYVDMDALSRFQYSYDFFRSTNTYQIKIKSGFGDTKAARTYRDMKLQDIYDAHHAELIDMINIREAYSDKYIERMMLNFKDAGLTYEEVYKMAFGVEYLEDHYFKKPLSKFKKDILTELKLAR